jgi:hypothetical protein
MPRKLDSISSQRPAIRVNYAIPVNGEPGFGKHVGAAVEAELTCPGSGDHLRGKVIARRDGTASSPKRSRLDFLPDSRKRSLASCAFSAHFGHSVELARRTAPVIEAGPAILGRRRDLRGPRRSLVRHACPADFTPNTNQRQLARSPTSSGT